MLENFVQILFLLGVFYIFGVSFRNILKLNQIDNYFEDIFLGIFFISFVGMIVSFFIPLNITFSLFMLLSTSAFFIYKANFKKVSLDKEFIIIFTFFTLVICLFMGYEHYPFLSDTDYYHANAVKWLSQEGTLRGLANLNSRFGFNSTWHIVAAFTDSLWLNDKTTWLMPLLSYTSTFGYFAYEYLKSSNIWIKAYSVIIIFWTFINIYTWGFPSLHYDFIPLVYNAILIFKVLKIELKNKDCSVSDLNLIFIFATASFLLKPMAALSVLFAFVYISYKSIKVLNLRVSSLLKICIIPLMALTAWLARNIILSGWPLFPSPILGFNVDWRTSYESTLTSYKEVKAWARMPIPDLERAMNSPFTTWFPFWIKNNFSSTRFILLAIIPTIITIITVILKFKKLIISKSFIYLIIWHLSVLAFWFLIAPDIRFGDGFFIVLMATTISYVISDYDLKLGSKITKRFFQITIFSLSLGCTVLLITGKRGPVGLLRTGLHNSGPIIKKKIQFDNNSYFETWIPVSVEQCHSDIGEKVCPNKVDEKLYTDLVYCSNSPLPCMPQYNEKIRFRNNLNYNEGFRLFSGD